MAMSTIFTISLYLNFLLHLSTTTVTATTLPYTATNHILLDCGSVSNTTSEDDGRNWQADTNIETDTNTLFQASSQGPFVHTVPYTTARIFQSRFTYNFPQLSNGPKFIRLYFYPSIYSTFNTTNSYFSAIANNYTLLTNFSAYLTVSSTPLKYTLIKEYIINIINNEVNITFLPSLNSFAFVNGIEIVSIPDTLYYTGKDIQLVAQSIPFNILNNTAFETLYRLNVGGSDLLVTDDTGMFRSWSQDDQYIRQGYGLTPKIDFTVKYTSDAPAYTAPEIVYRTIRFMNYNYSLQYNMTWSFPVDSGFYYLLRLHFCQIYSDIEVNDIIFTIFINNQTAEEEADVNVWGEGSQVAVKKDYIIYVADPDRSRSKQDLWLAMHPSIGNIPRLNNSFLNGLEIFKFTQTGNLSAPNPKPNLNPNMNPSVSMSPEKKKIKHTASILPVVGGVIGGIVSVIAFVCFLIFRRRKKAKDPATTSNNTKSSWITLSDKSGKTSGSGSTLPLKLPSNLCRHFSIEEILRATSNFDDKFVIGVGGFGKVYKGCIDTDTTNHQVAIKRLDSSSHQGAREFLTEIELLSKLRHVHLVSLIGYCDENGEMILVYEYMSHGTLRDHLYKTENPPLSLTQRLQICIGAAKGLHYLHTSAKHTIIHRDVKSTNILLDEKWMAKVSDFGLSRIGPTNGTQTHVSTVVKGSFGYLDPEYYRRQQLTEKSDVYSFGVVLLEVLSARPAIIPGLPKEKVNLAEWARISSRKGTINQILDPYLKDKIAAECLEKCIEIAISCLKDKGVERPTMNDIVWSLKFALQLQEAAEKGGIVNIHASTNSLSVPLILHGDATSTEGDDMFSRSEDVSVSSRTKSSDNFTATSIGDELKSENVFSEIMNTTGR